MLEHGFNFTSSSGVYKYGKVIGIKKDLNPISVERQTQVNRYIFTCKFVTNSYTQELKISVVLNSANGNVTYKILTTNIPANYYQHLPIIVTTDNGCDIYLCTLKETGFASIKLEYGDPNNIVLYPIGQATISESDALALQNQVSPSFISNRLPSQTPTEITTDYGKIIIFDLKNGTYMLKFIGNSSTTTGVETIHTLDSSLTPRSSLDVTRAALTKTGSTTVGCLSVETSGNVRVNLPDSYLAGYVIIVV